jgi:hypothetical protein
MSLPIQPHDRHKHQANHNEILLHETCFADPCSKQKVTYQDWNITILFYTALHYVQSYLCENRTRYGYRTTFGNHTDRNNYLARIAVRDHRIRKILTDYIALCHASFTVRYTPCAYHYVKQTDICSYQKFVLEDLPKTLGIA